MPGQIGVPGDPAQHLAQQVKGLIDRNDDGDSGKGQGAGRGLCEQGRVQPAMRHQRVDPHDPLDPPMCRHVAVPDPGPDRGQGPGGVAQKTRDQPQPPQRQTCGGKAGQGGLPGPVAKRQMQQRYAGLPGQIQPEAAPVGGHVNPARAQFQPDQVHRRPAFDQQTVIVQGNAGDLADRRAAVIAQRRTLRLQRQMPGGIAQKQPFDPCWHQKRPCFALQPRTCFIRSQSG